MANEEIKTFSDREQARKKLPVFFGSNDNFYHPIRESVVNARDILQDVENAKIIVTLLEDNKTVIISDNGKGLPMDGSTNGIENYNLLFLTLFSGTKMDDGSTDGGTNGCGNTVICYTSDYMEATVKRNGKIYNIAFENGGTIIKPFSCLGKTKEQGTEIKFRLSDAVYTNTIFDPKEVEFIVEKICATSPDIEATFIYKDYKKTFSYNNLEDYFDRNIIENKTIKNIIMSNKTFSDEYIDKDENETRIENTSIELIINNCEDNIQHSFLNGIYLPKMGTIHEGVIDGLRDVLNKFTKENGLYDKKEKQITRQDIEESISYACSVLSTKVSFSNQTKFSTEKELYKVNVKRYIQEYFGHYTIEHKDNILLLVNRILLNKRSREKAEINRKEVKKKLEGDMNKSTSRPEKFVPCKSKDKNKKELILIEGDSSLNSVKLSRDKLIHSIYPLKGKPLNALKKSLEEILKNEEIIDIFQILQCGMQYKGKPIKGVKHFNIDDLDVSKIIAFCDEDEDGLHIRSLLICIFYVLAPEIITNGHLYILDSPLYRLDTKDKTLLAYNEKEKNDIIRDLNKKRIKFVDSRFKGLGGLSINLLSETAMNINNRKLTQITMKDFNKAKQVLEMFMDDDSTDRKAYIEENGEKYFDYSIYED
jgi:DNA gyrase subunit B